MAYKWVQYIFYPTLTQDPTRPYGLYGSYTLLEEAKYRATHMLKVLNYARDLTPQILRQNPVKDVKDSDVLKIFLAPEFFFRSAYGQSDGSGHYSLFEVQSAREVIRNAVFKDSGFDDWFILPGTAIYCQHRANEAKEPVIFNEAWAFARSTATNPKVENTAQKTYFSVIDGLDSTKSAMLGASALAKLRKYVNHQIIEYGGVVLGFEICLDHRVTALKTTVTAANPPRPVDVHLLVSCGMEPIPASVAARSGGYLIRCNGNDWEPPRAQVFHVGTWPNGGVPTTAGQPPLVDQAAHLWYKILPLELQIYGPGVNDVIGYSDFFPL
jgi:hypothetical protein